MTKNYAKKLLSKNWTELTKAINEIEKIYPGVYLISWSREELEGEKVQLKDVYYIGMTNAKGGVKSRLKQFRNGIIKGVGHSGGNRWRKEKNKGKEYDQKNGKKFYSAYVQIECIVIKGVRSADDLRKMGNITKLEYEMMALYKKETGGEPEGNKK